MEEHHKEAIKNNLSFLCRDVDYSRFRPELIKNKLFPERQLRLMEEKDGNVKLEVFLQVQRRGPTAFRRLIASLAFSGHDESVRALTRNDDSLLMDVANTDSFNPNQDHSFDLTDSPLHPSQIHVEPANVLRYEFGREIDCSKSENSINNSCHLSLLTKHPKNCCLSALKI